MRDKPDRTFSGGTIAENESEIDPATRSYDKPTRLLRLPEVMARVGLKRTEIYQRAKEGRFPQPRSLGSRCSVWVEAEIDEWICAVINNAAH